MTASPDDISSDLKEKVRQAETAPGVYLMKDTSGRILYVGKAKNRRNIFGGLAVCAVTDP